MDDVFLIMCVQNCPRCGFKDWCDMLHEKGLADFDKALWQEAS